MNLPEPPRPDVYHPPVVLYPKTSPAEFFQAAGVAVLAFMFIWCLWSWG